MPEPNPADPGPNDTQEVVAHAEESRAGAPEESENALVSNVSETHVKDSQLNAAATTISKVEGLPVAAKIQQSSERKAVKLQAEIQADDETHKRAMLQEWWDLASTVVDSVFDGTSPPNPKKPLPSAQDPESEPLIRWMLSAFRGGELFFERVGQPTSGLHEQSDLQQSIERLNPTPQPVATSDVFATPATVVGAPSQPVSPAPVDVILPSAEELAVATTEIARVLGIPAASLIEGFRGTAAEVQLQAVACARQVGSDPRIVRTLLQFILARTMIRLEAERSSSAEDRVDTVVAVLAASRNLTPTLSFRRLVARLRATLDEQETDRRGDGYYLTWSILGDLLSRHDDRDCERQASVYYHEVLCSQIELLQKSDGPPSNPMKERTRVGANNMAAYIGRKLRDDEGLRKEVRDAARSMRLKLSRLATACSIAVVNHPQSERELAAVAVSDLCFLETENGPRFSEASVVAIDELMRNPMTGAGADPLEYFQWAFNEAAAALARLALKDRFPDAPGSFFNSGVSLLRLSGAIKLGGTSSEANPWVAYVRVLTNGLGLWWSLMAPEDWEDALEKRDGLDCAVNLMGAIVDSRLEKARADAGADDGGARSTLEGIIRTLFACRVQHQATHRFASDVTAWTRLQSSSAHLGIKTDGPRIRAGSPAALQKMVETFLLQFLKIHPEVEPTASVEWPSSDPLRPSAKLLHRAFLYLWNDQFRSTGKEWGLVPQNLVDHCNDLTMAAKELRNTFTTSYRDCFDPTLPPEDKTRNRGPLLACGLETEASWHALCEFAWGHTASEGGPRLSPEKLSDALGRNSYDWLR